MSEPILSILPSGRIEIQWAGTNRPIAVTLTAPLLEALVNRMNVQNQRIHTLEALVGSLVERQADYDGD